MECQVAERVESNSGLRLHGGRVRLREIFSMRAIHRVVADFATRVRRFGGVRWQTRAAHEHGLLSSRTPPAVEPAIGTVSRGDRKQPPNSQCSWHVLVVDDYPAVRAATQLLLKAQGYEVITAASAAEAIERARSARGLDVLITDYHLDGHDTGKEVICALRQIRGPSLKAIVITGDTSSAVHRFDGDSCVCWLNKPVDPNRLLALLENLLPRYTVRCQPLAPKCVQPPT